MKQAISMVGSIIAVFLFTVGFAFAATGDNAVAIGLLGSGIAFAVLALGLATEPRRDCRTAVISRW